MQKRISVFCLILVFGLPVLVNGQAMKQTIRGKVRDADSRATLPGANVVILSTDPLRGTNTESDGNFKIEGVPVGRYRIQVSFIGYQTAVIPEVLVNSGKETVLTIDMKEVVTTSKEVVITARIEKDKPLNTMASISARSFSVEETRRFAGAADDPLRAASGFAGVNASPDVNSNGIIIRGNSPKGLLWRLDGVDIPNPNHFGDVGQSGGGITIFSSQVLTNSDFYTAAFPAEYGNALSGVFDMRFRNGNESKREYAFQAGIMGLDFSTEGPFKKGNSASYLVNYRYSIYGILQWIDPSMKNKVPSYHDLSFKINLPSGKAGTFSVTAISGLDHSKFIPEKDSLKWKTNEDIQRNILTTGMGAIALSHNILLNRKSYLKSTLACTGNYIDFENGFLGPAYALRQLDQVEYLNSLISFSSFINRKFGPRHTNRTGFYFNRSLYRIHIKAENPFTGIFGPYVDESGNTWSFQAFSQSKYDLATTLP